ncbi:hypothetical protein [Acinetobacter sp. WCHAc060007]|uniref:hypothetical protein n=1 Tax=Acinetobacter sp. WCHAc060007 TaxID=2419605 RepID=UPI000EA01A17|nr:hypothetical protein [Acinetobacter sp. WCHAc060007]RKG44857.1 hypothetical protein D7V31_01285 [Acinetobacter sp. WCHAc060007]
MNLEIHTGLGARFKLQAKKAQTNEITRESAWSDNIVLDSGLARMSAGDWFDRCCVGAGNSVPNAGQVALDSFIASTTTKQEASTFIEIAAKPYHYGVRITWRFGIGVAAGNISELGIGWGNNNLWDRALVKDTSGNPTTITVLSDEYLDVISEIRVYPKDTISGTFNLLDKTGGIKSTHNFTGIPIITSATVTATNLRLERLVITNGSIQSVNSPPSGSQIAIIRNEGGAVLHSYPTQTSFEAVCKMGLGDGNGIHKSFWIGMFGPLVYGIGAYQFEITPPITKNNMQEMTYTVTGSWGRYEPA